MLNCPDDKKLRAWLKAAPLKDVEGFIDGSSPTNSVHQHAIAERDKRYHELLRKPHWTLTPGFWVAFAAMVFAAIAAWPVIREWIFGSSH